MSINHPTNKSEDRWRLLVVFILAVIGACAYVIYQGDAKGAAGDPPAGFVAVDPVRIMDTRQTSPLGAGETLTMQNGGTNGVPKDATALQLNVTALGATEGTHVTLYPCGAVPTTSTLNTGAGLPPVVNGATVGLSAGSFCVYNYGGRVNVLIDLLGYYVP